MKKLLFPAFAFLAMMASCAKEADVNEETRNKVEVRALIDNSDVKTNYDIDGSTATFYWTGTEVFGRLHYDNGVGTDTYTSTTSAANKETTLTFSGYQDGTSSNYALYPLWDGTNTNGLDCRLNGKVLNLYLAETIAYNPDAPLKDIVPMIGTLTNGEFEFVPATGVIAVTVKNLPSTATKITLSSGGDNALSGTYRVTSNFSDLNVALSGVTLGLTTDMAYNSGNNSGKKTLTFSGLDRGTYTFYFPVSVATSQYGKYVNLTISVYAGDLLLQTVTNPNQITVGKGQIVRFPEMDLAKATKVKLTGSAIAPFAYVEKFGPDAHIRYAIATTANDAITSAETGEEISTVGEENKFSIIPDNGSAGYYYLGYQVVDSENNVLLTDAIKFCYSASDPSDVLGTYSKTDSFAWKTEPETVSWTVSASDDWTKGNIKLGTSIWNLSSVYGVYDGEKITIDGQTSRFSGNPSHCLAGDWESDAYNSRGIVTDIVFTLDNDGNLTTTKVGIGNTITLENGLIKGFYLTTRYISGSKTWVKVE